MTAASEKIAWAFAAALSIGLHATAAGALMLMSQESATRPAETAISVIEMPSAAATAVPVDVASVAAFDGETLDAARLEQVAPVRQERMRISPETPRTVETGRQSRPRVSALEPSAAWAVTDNIVRESVESRIEAARPDRPQAAPSIVALQPQTVARPSSAPVASASTNANAERITDIAPSVLAVAPLAAAAAAPEPVAEIAAPAQAPTRPTLSSTAEPATVAAERPEPGLLRPAGDIVERAEVSRPAVPKALAPVAPHRPDPVANLSRPTTEQEIAALTPVSPAIPDAGSPGDAYRGVLDFLRDYQGGGCFVVLPSARLGGLVGLDGFAAEKDRLTAFMGEFRNATGVLAEANLDPVSNAQCRALSFARTMPRYPAFSLYFELENSRLRSGDRLFGTIHNVDERPLHLLLVDDEGTVQSVDGFVTETGAHARFAAYMTLTDGPVATVQLLVALAGESRLETIETHNGEHADRFFAALTEEVARRGISLDLAIASFSVR